MVGIWTQMGLLVLDKRLLHVGSCTNMIEIIPHKVLFIFEVEERIFVT